MTNQRPGRTVDEIRASLQGFSADELADILAHVLKEYVVESPRPVNADLGHVKVPTHLRQLSFLQLVEVLKGHLDLPELDMFTVADGDVFVKIGGRDFSLTRPVAPPPVPAAPEPAAPASAAERGQPGAAAKGAAPAPAPGDKQSTKKVEISDRFRMLELD